MRAPAPRVLAVLVALGFAARIAWQLRSGFYIEPETWEFDAVARNLANGAGYVFRYHDSDWRTYGTPLYPLTLALFHIVGGTAAYWLIGPFQAAVSALASVPAFWIGRRLHSDAAGVLAAAVVAAHPGLLVYSAKVHELNLEMLLATLFLAAVLDLARNRSGHQVWITGILGGINAFARPTLTAFTVAAYAILAVARPRRPLLVAAIISVAFSLPWTLRNIAILGPDAPSSPYSCATLWMGNNPNASGTTLGLDGRSVFLSMPDDMRARVLGQPEEVQARVFCAEATDYMTADPLRTVRVWVQKLGYFWWFSPYSGQLYPSGWLELYRGAYLAEIAFVLIGAAAIWRAGWRLGLLLVLLDLAVVSASQSIAYVEGRHRLLLEPVFASIAGAGAVALVGRARAMRANTLPTS